MERLFSANYPISLTLMGLVIPVFWGDWDGGNYPLTGLGCVLAARKV